MEEEEEEEEVVSAPEAGNLGKSGDEILLDEVRKLHEQTRGESKARAVATHA